MAWKDKEKQREYNKERRKKHKEIGLCRFCNQPVMPGYTNCFYHLEKNKEYKKKQSKKNKARGICHSCNQPVMSGHIQCVYHHYKKLEYNKTSERREAQRIHAYKYDARMRLENKCTKCGAPLMGGENIRCVACKIKGNEGYSIKGVIKYAIAY